MSKQYPGGLITKNPVIPAGNTQTSAASGVWTLAEQAYWAKQNLWPTAGILPTDQYFEYVTALLNGNGVNGSQNNTFLDSSTNNSSITRNGSVTQGTWSPYGVNWSNYFSGSNSLSFANNAAFSLNSSAFTIEAWVNFDTVSGDRCIMGTYGSGTTGWTFQLTGGVIRLYTAGDTLGIAGTTTIVPGVWYHVAVSGTAGTSMKLFVNGVQEGSTYTGNIANSSAALSVGQIFNVNYIIGYVSNARVVKGTALYTSNFTPSTTPLTAITNTSLLTCQANRFIDSSANAFTCSLNGSPTVQRFSPFSPTTAYDAAAIGGSSYYDGSSYLSVPTSTAAFDFGSGNYTLEFWYYPISFATQSWSNGIVTKYSYSYANYNSGGFGIENPADGSGYIVFKPYAPAGYYTNTVTIEQANALKKGMWQHIAMVKSGTTAYAFINGVLIGTATVPSATAYGSHALFIGAWDGVGERGIQKLNGYISGLRIAKSAIYTAAFTPPTTPPTAIATTSFLANFTNAGISDSAAMNNLDTVGNAQVSTSVVKYGTGSIALDGTGDYLTVPSSPNLGFGSGDFTVEAWVYLTANIANAVGGYLTDFRNGSTLNFALGFIGNSGVTKMYDYVNNNGATSTIGTSTVILNTWHHVAWVRSGTTVTMYFNGTANGTMTTSYSQGPTGVTIGARYTGVTEYITGYVDDLRITKGVARYTANFTPPTSQLPAY
jgi:hypothetical protein